MAVAWDASAEREKITAEGGLTSITWTHTPTGTPRGVVVAIVRGTDATDIISGVTYGGDALTRVVRATDTATEAGSADLWFVGTSIPTGAQTVEVSFTGSDANPMHGVSMTVTADEDTEVVDFDSLSENQANPSVTLSYSGRTCLSVAALYSGLAAPADFTANANCTAVQDQDFGPFASSVIRQTTPGTSDFAIGGTSAADDVAFAALALSEVQAISGSPWLYRSHTQTFG